MKKYYIGLAVIMAMCIGSLVYAVSQGSDAKTDNATNKAADQISTQLDTYIAQKNLIPSSLSEAGIKNVPTTVQYQRLSDSKYKVCLNYKTAAGGFDAGWSSLLNGALGGGSTYTPAANSSYFDASVETSHKKGQNCQTITPYVYDSSGYGSSSSYGNSSGTQADNTACDASIGSYTVYGYLTISSVDKSAKQVNFSPDNQDVTDQSGNTLPDITSKTYDDKTLFCDQNYKPTDASALVASQNVIIYLKSSTDTTISRLDISY